MSIQLMSPEYIEAEVEPMVILPPGMGSSVISVAEYDSKANANTSSGSEPLCAKAWTTGTAPDEAMLCHPRPRRPEMEPDTMLLIVSHAAKVWLLRREQR